MSRLDASGRFDISTVEGSTATLEAFKARRSAAQAFFAAEVRDLLPRLDELDRAYMSLMTSLAERDMTESYPDMADIARASYLVRLFLEGVVGESDGEDEAAPAQSDVTAAPAPATADEIRGMVAASQGRASP